MQQEDYQKRYKQRGNVIESIFGIIKHNYKFAQFHLRGLIKVQSEVMLAFTAYNINRLFTLGFKLKGVKR